MENPLVGILIAAGFVRVDSVSSATTGIVIVMDQGFITLPAGIALAFGANIRDLRHRHAGLHQQAQEAVRAAAVHVSVQCGR